MKGNKLLAGVLSAAMVLGTMAFPAFADDETNDVANQEALVALCTTADTENADVIINITDDFELNTGIRFVNANTVTINGNGHKVTMKDVPEDKRSNYANMFSENESERPSGFAISNGHDDVKSGSAINVNDLTIVNQKNENENAIYTSAHTGRARYYTSIYAENVNFTNVNFNGGVSVTNNSSFENCKFSDTSSKRYLLFVDNEFGGTANINTQIKKCNFNGNNSSYGGLKIADDKDKGVNLTLTGSTFENIVNKPAVYVNGESVVAASDNTFTNCEKGEIVGKDSNKNYTAVAQIGNKYYTDFSTAFDAANAMTEPAVINCLTDEIITNKGRYAIKNSITINGNGAAIKKSDNPNSSIEFSTEEIDKDIFTSNINFTVNNLNNIAVWGYRKSNVEFNVALNGCKDVDRIYITGTDGINNITVDDCTFTKYDSANNDTSIYSNNPGALTVTNSTFTAIPIAININNKSDGERTVNISGCKFINCGEPSNTSNPTYAAPVRFVTTQDNGKITAEVSSNTIANDDPSKKTHGDILLGDGRNGKKSTSNVTVVVENNNSALTVKNEYPDGTASVAKDFPAGTSGTVSNVVVADTIALKFVKHTDDERVYDIVLNGDGKDINRLNAAEFEFNMSNANMTYEIKAADKMTTLYPDVNKYVFYFDGKDAINNADSGADITIGTVTFDGYGAFTFEAASGRVTATTTSDNLVTEFVTTAAAGKGTLKIGDDTNKIITEIKVPTQVLTVNVLMNHPVTAQTADYQDMTVAISGGDLAGKVLTYKLGDTDSEIDETTKTVAQTNGSYQIKTTLTRNKLYTVTVSGAGYRTARYTVTMSADKTMNVWNNVMSNEIVVVDNTKATKNFLAGDIIKDGTINIYDLSAVVAYFGQPNIDKTTKSNFAKYDLNRDGVIDMMDISIVLASWGK